MENAVNTISTTLTPAVLWEQVGSIMPVVLGVVVFAFGFYLIRKLIKGFSKGKARI